MAALDGIVKLLVAMTMMPLVSITGLSVPHSSARSQGGSTECNAFYRQGSSRIQPTSLPEAIPSFLKEYAKFHQASLLRLLINRSRGAPARVQFLVFHCIPEKCGGLGDRFKGIMGAFYLAVVTQRVFVIQHGEFPLTDSLVPNAIDWHSYARCLPSYQQSGQSTFLNAFQPPTNYMVAGNSSSSHRVFDADRLISDVVNAATRVVHLRLNHPIWNQILDSRMASTLMASREASQRSWVAPRGPRFAWGWHLLFRPSEGMEQDLAQQKRALGIPRDGTPWLAVHLRTGAHEQFQDDWVNPNFCRGLEHGVAMFAACASRFADLVSQPPFAKPGRGKTKPLDPHSIPIFIASDNSQAVQVMRAQLLEGGHKNSAIANTGRPVVHAGRLPRSHATLPVASLKDSDVRRTMMLTITEILLMSQSTCIIMAMSGFAHVAEWLSRDMTTGARCAIHAGDCQQERVQALAGPGEEDGLNDRTRISEMQKKFHQVCSEVVLRGHTLCPASATMELVFRLRLSHSGSLHSRTIWKTLKLRSALVQHLGLRDICQVDVMVGKPGQLWVPRINLTEQVVTITLHMDQGVLLARLQSMKARSRSIGTAMSEFGDSILEFQVGTLSLDSHINITVTTGGAPPLHMAWNVLEPASSSIPPGLSQGLPQQNLADMDSEGAKQQRKQQLQKPSSLSQWTRGELPSAKGASNHVTNDQIASHALPEVSQATVNRTYCLISDKQVHINMRLAASAQYNGGGPPGSPPDLAASLLQGGGAGAWVDQLAVMAQGSQVLVSADGPADVPASRHGVLGTVTLNRVTLPTTRSLRIVIPGSGFKVQRERGNFILLSVPDVIELRIEVVIHRPPGQTSPTTLQGRGALKLTVTSFQGSEDAQGMLGQHLRRGERATSWATAMGLMAKGSNPFTEYLTTGMFGADCHGSRYGKSS
eukprot:jgi/Mesvir1/28991/Mv17761-RA.1